MIGLSVQMICLWATMFGGMVGLVMSAPGDPDKQQIEELRQKWNEVVDESTQTNKDMERFEPPITSIPNEESLRVRVQGRVRGKGKSELPFLTGTLLAWVTTQTENIVEELEAVSKDNAQSDRISIKNYVRYLSLYNDLGIIAEQPIDELRWVQKKHKIFGGVFQSAEHVVLIWLNNRETEISKEEKWELSRDNLSPHLRLNRPTDKWIELYENIKYIANQASLPKELVDTARNMLNKSPDGEHRQRNMRYMSITRSHNK